MFRLFLLLTLKMTRTLDPKDAASIKERIPEVIDMFCPGVNVCRENRSTNSSLTNPNFRRLFWMCCTGIYYLIKYQLVKKDFLFSLFPQ
jgi:hypothetical protein